MTRVLVCGGRNYDDVGEVYRRLDSIPDVSLIIEGGANGADTLAQNWASENDIDFTFNTKNVLHLDITGTDLLFIDTYHTYDQLKEELRLHGNKASKYLIMHDTTIFGRKSADGSNKGLIDALEEYLGQNPHWKIIEQTNDKIGLTVLQRFGP